jgi:quercetin dioxygenase-like cupin family protein
MNIDIFKEGAAAGALLEYQTDAVVSKTIIDKPGGTVTLFAFDKGQGLSEHTAPFDALVFCVDGKVSVRIGGEPRILSAGDMTVMPADIPHALKAEEKFKMLLVMIKK